MSAQKVAIVTGSNKGIGFAIVELLCKKLGPSWDVFLTSRDEGRGLAAVKEMEAKGAKPKFHQLDIDNKESIGKLASFMKSTYGGIDILVNNAALAFLPETTVSLAEQAETTMRTNFFSTVVVCDALFPLLRPHARVVNVCSGASDMCLMAVSPELQKRLMSEMDMEGVKKLMTEYVEAVKNGTHGQLGWPDMCMGWPTPYNASKVGVRLMTYAQAKAMASDPREDVVISSVCPGFVDTDMNAHRGVRTVYEGAETPVYAATLPPNVSQELVGKHFYDSKVVPWQPGAVLNFLDDSARQIVTGNKEGQQ